MRHGLAHSAAYQPWPRWWRMVLIAISMLILCSCQLARVVPGPSGYPAAGPPTLPREAFTGVPTGQVGVAGEVVASGPMAAPGQIANRTGAAALPSMPVGPWAPSGLRRDPWPRDEYLCDGGDMVPHATVGEDWEVRGLNVEDTIGHFDTVDGRRIVTPSNRVCIYSPRFGSVRQVVSLNQNEQRNPWASLHQPLRLVRHDDVQIAATSKQHEQLQAEISQKLPILCRAKQGDGAMSSVNGPVAFQDKLLPFEAPLAIGQGIIEESEMAWLADKVAAAITWSGSQPVQVFIDRTKAMVEVSDQKLAAVYTVRRQPANPRLRVIKVASTHYAAPGETIDFTIRFDNVGDQVIGNVTIIDNLTTRLEYVPGSAQCSVPAEFFTAPNEGDSLVLRWEITDPLPRDEGGIIRFRCRVR